MPIQRTLPKFGFKNPTRIEFQPVNVAAIQALVEAAQLTEITPAVLFEAGLVSKNGPVKVLGNGEISAKVEVTAHAFSKSAIAKIEAAGGKATTL